MRTHHLQQSQPAENSVRYVVASTFIRKHPTAEEEAAAGVAAAASSSSKK